MPLASPATADSGTRRSAIRRSVRAASLILACIAATPAAALSHTVGRSETLFGLSLEYDVPVSWIRRANGMSDDVIKRGQVLEIPVDGLSGFPVLPGDTLLGLAVELGTTTEELIAQNGLRSDVLRAGQRLSLAKPADAGTGAYTVRPGDTLSGIARSVGATVERLRLWNGLEDDVIRPGQSLAVAPPRPEVHRVGAGESLWLIAERYGITDAELAAWNGKTGGVIVPGELLALYPGMKASDLPSLAPPTGAQAAVTLASVSHSGPARQDAAAPARSGLPRVGEYFYSAPALPSQPDVRYGQEAEIPHAEAYRRGIAVLADLDAEIASLPRLGRQLQGWRIVIDPGHGGMDPGAIVSLPDGNGNPVVITEDEYSYDIAVRLYRLLARYGAQTTLTILAPDHHVRDGEDARRTFVNRKNEVYNDEAHNTGPGAWRPVGTVDGLDERKRIAARAFAGARRGRTLFISIHADNSPDLPAGTAVLFDGDGEDETAASRQLAETLAPHLGLGSFAKQQALRVLRGNPADAAVLIEARNIHYPQNAWAIRSSALREEDARMIAEGVLDWASRR